VIVCGTVLAVRFLAPEPTRPPAARKTLPARQEAPVARPRPLAKPAEEPAAPPRAPAPPTAPPPAASKEPPVKAPIHEVFPEKDPGHPAEDGEPLRAALPPPGKPGSPEFPPPKKLPRVAIIIDDLGYDRHLAEKLVQLNAPFTLAILPFSPHLETVSRLAHASGLEIILHLPMEPVEYPEIQPGPGALLTSMTADEMLRVLEADLDSLPHIKGVNNHMGSRLTAHAEKIYQVFSVLKKRGLFFVDSRTTDESICRPSARLFQIPFAQRDVFLDHSTDANAIRKQVRLLVRIAYQKGEAVGIGHPNPATVSVLREALPTLRQQVELVPVSQLVRVVE
jgi:polysaccharide deacetylase 2 family uncharacterized protein YibQ